MIAKQLSSSSSANSVFYNEDKIKKGEAHIISTSAVGINPNTKSTIAIIDSLNNANTRSKNNSRHIILSFDPSDAERLKNDPQLLKEITQDYLNKIGYSEQPHIAYAHTDTNIFHVHIVTTSIHAETSKKIYTDKEGEHRTKLFSLQAVKDVEEKFNLTKHKDRSNTINNSSDLSLKSKITMAVKDIETRHNPSNIHQLNYYLQNEYNITVKPVSGKLVNQDKEFFKGYTYQDYIQNENVSPPIKSSLLKSSGSFTHIEKMLGENRNNKKAPSKREIYVFSKELNEALNNAKSFNDINVELNNKGSDYRINPHPPKDGKTYSFDVINLKKDQFHKGSDISNTKMKDINSSFEKNSNSVPISQQNTKDRSSSKNNSSADLDNSKSMSDNDFNSNDQYSIDSVMKLLSGSDTYSNDESIDRKKKLKKSRGI